MLLGTSKQGNFRWISIFVTASGTTAKQPSPTAKPTAACLRFNMVFASAGLVVYHAPSWAVDDDKSRQAWA